jgi:hypothetical protein
MTKNSSHSVTVTYKLKTERGCSWCVSVFRTHCGAFNLFQRNLRIRQNIPKQGVTDVCDGEARKLESWCWEQQRESGIDNERAPILNKKMIHSLLLRASFSLQKGIVCCLFTCCDEGHGRRRSFFQLLERLCMQCSLLCMHICLMH